MKPLRFKPDTSQSELVDKSEPQSEAEKIEPISVLEKEMVNPSFAVEIQDEKYAFEKPVFGINKIARDSAFSSKGVSVLDQHI